jgi:hypothetical protein
MGHTGAGGTLIHEKHLKLKKSRVRLPLINSPFKRIKSEGLILIHSCSHLLSIGVFPFSPPILSYFW